MSYPELIALGIYAAGVIGLQVVGAKWDEIGFVLCSFIWPLFIAVAIMISPALIARAALRHLQGDEGE